MSNPCWLQTERVLNSSIGPNLQMPHLPTESHNLKPAGPNPHPDCVTPSWEWLHPQTTKRLFPRLLFDILSLTLCLNSVSGFCANTQTALWVILTAGEVFICLPELSRSPGVLIGIWALPLERSRAVNIWSYLHGRGVLWHNNIPSSANAEMRVSDTRLGSKPGRKDVE